MIEWKGNVHYQYADTPRFRLHVDWHHPRYVASFDAKDHEYTVFYGDGITTEHITMEEGKLAAEKSFRNMLLEELVFINE